MKCRDCGKKSTKVRKVEIYDENKALINDELLCQECFDNCLENPNPALAWCPSCGSWSMCEWNGLQPIHSTVFFVCTKCWKVYDGEILKPTIEELETIFEGVLFTKEEEDA